MRVRQFLMFSVHSFRCRHHEILHTGPLIRSTSGAVFGSILDFFQFLHFSASQFLLVVLGWGTNMEWRIGRIKISFFLLKTRFDKFQCRQISVLFTPHDFGRLCWQWSTFPPESIDSVVALFLLLLLASSQIGNNVKVQVYQVMQASSLYRDIKHDASEETTKQGCLLVPWSASGGTRKAASGQMAPFLEAH